VSTDEDQIAAYLAKNGPLSIGINASWLQLYVGGISNPLICSPKHLDHGVLIVGYGEQNGKKFWKVKNSWGAGWGEQGYFRIIRGKGKCGLNTMVTHSIA
jgi:C1A family cysteine protease